ncbi:MAG: hypothetical protein ACHRHE_12250 [Tepidisphaerales bacterium]
MLGGRQFRGVFLFFAAVLVAGGIACDQSKADRSISQTRPATAASAAPAPPKAPAATGDAPLLLDDAPAAAVEGQADNSRCQVCHLNLVAEELVVKHAKVNIGCARCHGECDAHIADESWGSGGNGTAPDKMYPPARINPMCLECHPRDQLDYKSHRTFLEGVGDEKFCVNCHGKHKLPVRKCKWK